MLLLRNKKNKRRHIRNSIRFLGLIILIIILVTVDFHDLLWQLQNILPEYIIYASLFIFLAYIFKSLRWFLLIRIANIKYSYPSSLLAFMSSNFIGFITPGRIGEFAKVIYLKNDVDASWAASFATVLFDRLFDIYILLSVSIVGVLFFSLPDNMTIWLIVISSSLLILPLIIFHKKAIHCIANNVLRLKFLRKYNNRTLEGVDKTVAVFKNLLSYKLFLGFILTLISYFFVFYAGNMLIKSLGIELHFFQVAFVLSIANVLSFIPITFSGLGTRETTFILLLGTMGYTPELAIAFSALVFLVFYIIGGVYGLIAFFIKPLEFGELKKQ